MDDAIYDEFGPALAWSARILITGSLVFAVVEAALGFPNDALGLLVGVAGSIIGVAGLSVHRHSRVRLTRSTLVIGREAVRFTDLDTAFGVRHIDDLDPSERFHVESPVPIPKSASIRIPGGAWGRILGTDVVVLRSRSEQKKLALFTRRGERLGRLLEAALAGFEPRQS